MRVAVGPGGSYKAFRRWSGATAAHDLRGFERIERIMMRALRRLVATARARAFAAFREVATRSRALDHLATTRRLALEKCLRRWTKRSLARGLETWATTTTFFHNLQRCILRILRRRLAISFSTWSGESFRLRTRDGLSRHSEWYEAVFDTLAPAEARARFQEVERPLLPARLRSDSIKRLDRVRRRCLTKDTPRDS